MRLLEVCLFVYVFSYLYLCLIFGCYLFACYGFDVTRFGLVGQFVCILYVQVLCFRLCLEVLCLYC